MEETARNGEGCWLFYGWKLGGAEEAVVEEVAWLNVHVCIIGEDDASGTIASGVNDEGGQQRTTKTCPRFVLRNDSD